jgi:hypothetical protein
MNLLAKAQWGLRKAQQSGADEWRGKSNRHLQSFQIVTVGRETIDDALNAST